MVALAERTTTPAVAVCDWPSIVSAALVSDVIPERLPANTTPSVGLAPVFAGTSMLIAPPEVVRVVFAPSVSGKVSPAETVVVPASLTPPTTLMDVPVGGEAPRTWSARLIVLNAQPGAVPELVLPVPVVSLPRTGSTKYVGLVPVTAAQAEQTPPPFASPGVSPLHDTPLPAHVDPTLAVMQQLPG